MPIHGSKSPPFTLDADFVRGDEFDDADFRELRRRFSHRGFSPAGEGTREFESDDTRRPSVRVEYGPEMPTSLKVAARSLVWSPLGHLAFLDVCTEIFSVFDFEFATIRHENVPLEIADHGPEEWFDVRIANVYGAAIVEEIGRDRLLRAPALAVRELAGGSVVLVAGVTSSYSENAEILSEYLRNPEETDVDRTPAPLPESEPPESLSDDLAGLLAHLGTWTRGDVRDSLEAADDSLAGRLSNLFDDDRESVRKEAAWGLGIVAEKTQNGDDRETAVGALVGALSDDSPAVREAAVEALEREPSAAAAEPLVDVCRSDPNPAVRAAAVEALSDYRSSYIDVERLLQLYLDVYKTDDASDPRVEALNEISVVTRNPRLAIEALDDADSEVRKEGARLLSFLTMMTPVHSDEDRFAEALDENADAVLRAAESPNPAIRKGGIRALALLDHEGTTDLLTETLREDLDADVRYAAVSALGTRDDENAVESLVAALEDSDSTVREGAARAIGDIAPRRAVVPLLEAAGDPDATVRKHAIRALGETDDERAVESLTRSLADPERQDDRRYLTEAIAELGGPDVELLLERAAAEDSRGRACAVRGLEVADDERALDLVIDATGADDERVRVAATEALRGFDDDRGVERLLELLDADDNAVRSRAVQSLGAIGDERATRALERRAEEDSVESIRYHARSAVDDRRRDG